MEKTTIINKWCDCIEPDFDGREFDDFIAVGTSGNVMDYSICGTCGLPIAGTASTHMDNEA